MARALIEESGRPAYVVRRNRSDDNFFRELKSAFAQAAETAPSIVLLDDMDKFAAEESDKEFAAVQSCIDEVYASDVFVIATANKKHIFSSSLLREGRFDRKIWVHAPVCQDAEKIIRTTWRQKICGRHRHG